MTEGAGQVIAGRYRLIDRLGRGGMGVVWRARDEVLGREVAVKEIRLPMAGSSPDDLVDLVARRALREARAAARLRHPAIVTVHDVVTDDGRPWIVMELVRGRSLAEALVADGVLPAGRAAEIGLKVLGALDAAHRRGILHRDVKPANIMLDGDRVVLTDFGIAAVDGATALTATGLLIGSPDYLAPEQINGRSPTAAVDMWGLGVTLYAAVAGRPPFHRADTQTTLAAVLVSDPEPLPSAPDLWPIIRGLLAKSPESRLAAADAIPLLTAVTTPPPVASPRQRRWTAMSAELAPAPVARGKRSIVLPGALILVAALVLTVLVVILGDAGPGTNPRDRAGPTAPTTASPTPPLAFPPAGWPLVLTDPLTAAGNWREIEATDGIDGICWFTPGRTMRYHGSPHSPQTWFPCDGPRNARPRADLAIEVTLDLERPACAGIYFGADAPRGARTHVYKICGNGQAELLRLGDGPLPVRVTSTAVPVGPGSKHRIGVVVIGDLVRLYVDGKYVAPATDGRVGRGYYGLGVFTNPTDFTVAYFSNFRLWSA